MAQEGGIGVVHKNLSIADQAREVEKVKRSENGVIVDPITLPPTATIGEARRLMREYHVSGVPIVEGAGAATGNRQQAAGGNPDLMPDARSLMPAPQRVKSFDEPPDCSAS